MEEHKDRIDTILRTVVDAYKTTIDEVEKKGIEIDQRLSLIQKMVYDHVRRQCNREFKWIEKNGSVTRSDQGFSVQINQNNSLEADANVKEFFACINRHDFSLKRYFDDMKGSQHMTQAELNHCISKCLGDVKMSNDDALKDCINTCVSISLNRTKDNYKDIEEKLQDVKNRLI